MATPSVVQTGTVQTVEGGFTLTGVTSGSALVMLGRQSASAGRTYSISDDKSNTWSISQQSDAGRIVVAAWAFGVAAGDTLITLSNDGTDQIKEWVVIEFANVGEVDVAFTGSVTDPATSLDVYSPAADFAADSVDFLMYQADAPTTVSVPTGYTQVDTDSLADSFYGYRINASAVTGDSGTITQATGRDGPIAGFSLKDSGGGGATEYTKTLTITGVGSSGIVKGVALTRAITGSGTSTYSKLGSFFRTLSISGIGTNAVAKGVAKSPFSVTGVGTPALTYGQQFVRALSYAATGTVSMGTTLVSLVSVAISGIGTSTLGRQVSNLVSGVFSGVGTSTVGKGIAKAPFTNSAAGSSSVTRGVAVTKSISGTGGAVSQESLNTRHTATTSGVGTSSGTQQFQAGGPGTPGTIRTFIRFLFSRVNKWF